jgi:hypothetical protein
MDSENPTPPKRGRGRPKGSGPKPGGGTGKLGLPPGATRANLALVEARLDEVCTRIGKLHTVRRMMRDLAVEWGLTPDSVLVTYIKPAQKRMRQEYEDAAPHAGDRIRETLANLYEKADEVGDHKTCAMVLKQMAMLDGANAPTTTNTHLAGGLGVEVAIGPGNPDATRDRMKELLARPEILAKLDALGLTPKK